MKNVLVIVFDFHDPRVLGIANQPASEKDLVFDIITDVPNTQGFADRWLCKVKLDDGSEQEYKMGLLALLLELPEEDAQTLTPSEAFAKWHKEIVKRQAIASITVSQRDLLREEHRQEFTQPV